jgi:hypothetical protein
MSRFFHVDMGAERAGKKAQREWLRGVCVQTHTSLAVGWAEFWARPRFATLQTEAIERVAVGKRNDLILTENGYGQNRGCGLISTRYSAARYENANLQPYYRYGDH